MTKSKRRNPTGKEIRAAFAQALREIPGPFNLSGRGCESRCTLDRRLAAYLRNVDLPHVYLSGFGANNHYPMRLIERAASILNESVEWQAISSMDRSFYLSKLDM